MQTITIENSPHFAEWVEELRTTKAQQVRNVLISGSGPDNAGFCCLGVGAKCADVPLVEKDGTLAFEYTTGDDDRPSTTDTMPPFTFHEWLGIEVTHTPNSDLGDVFIDWPDGDSFVGRAGEDADVLDDYEPYMLNEETAQASGLNDKLGLTFPQIADVLAYFGVKGEQ